MVRLNTYDTVPVAALDAQALAAARSAAVVTVGSPSAIKCAAPRCAAPCCVHGPAAPRVLAQPPGLHLLGLTATVHRCPALPHPTTRRAWVQLVGEGATQGMSIACIGSTSARAAEKLGLQRIKVVLGWGMVGLAEAGVSVLDRPRRQQAGAWGVRPSLPLRPLPPLYPPPVVPPASAVP